MDCYKIFEVLTRVGEKIISSGCNPFLHSLDMNGNFKNTLHQCHGSLLQLRAPLWWGNSLWIQEKKMLSW